MSKPDLPYSSIQGGDGKWACSHRVDAQVEDGSGCRGREGLELHGVGSIWQRTPGEEVGRQQEPSSKPSAHAPLSHWTLFIKHRFKGEMIKNLEAPVTEH